MAIRKSTIQNRLDELYNELSNGAVIRSRVTEIVDGEVNTTYFKSVEKFMQIKSVIESCVNDKDEVITDQGSILNMMGDFLQKVVYFQKC